MPLNPLHLNPGVALHNEYHGGESDTIREIPPEWRAALDLFVEEQPVPLDWPLFELSDEVLASKTEQKFTSEKTRRTTKKPPGMYTLIERFTDRNKEFGTRTRNFRFIDEMPDIATPSALQTVHTRNFGNKHFEEVIEGVPALFVSDEYDRSRPVVTPEDFRAELEEDEHGFTEIGIASDPSTPLPAGVISHKDRQEDVYTHRESIRSIDLLSLPKHIINKETNRFKQIETVDRILELESTTPQVPTALQDVDFKRLGDGTALEIVRSVASVFPATRWTKSIPDVTPEDFKALLPISDESSTTNVPFAEPPDPGSGVYETESVQETLYTSRNRTKSRDLSGLPTQKVNYKTNRFKQVETITRILESDSTTPDIPTDLKDVEFTVLGDGTALEIHIEVPDVFDEKTSATSIPDLLPEIFKAVLPSYTKEFVEPGSTITDPPSLATGDFFRSEKRETEFTRRITTRGRAGISLPQPVVASRQIGGERFGGEVTQLAGYLDGSEPAVETGLDIVTSKVINLGNGTWFRETEKLDTALFWPTLTAFKFDKEMQVLVEIDKQTVDSSYTPATPSVGDYWVEELEPIDQYHYERVKTTKTPTAVDEGSALVTSTWRPFQFPGWLATTGFGYYVRKARAELTEHTIKTWWMSKSTKPTTGPTGSGADVIVDPIIMDNIIISTLNDTSRLAYSGECLHDTLTTFGVLVWPATTPDMTTYTGSWIGTDRAIAVDITETDIPNLWKIVKTSVVMR